MKAVVAAFNQEKALVGAVSVIVQPVVEPMDQFAALIFCIDFIESPTADLYSVPAIHNAAILGAAAR